MPAKTRPHDTTRITSLAWPSHRQVVNQNLILNDAQCARLKVDPSLRLLLFSAIDQPLAPSTRIDITFPSQIEVRVNNEEIRENFKGLVNQPGSTRPADITSYVKTTPTNHPNRVTIIYALTQKASQPKEISYSATLCSASTC